LTHTGRFASAAVAATSAVGAIGIDTEDIVSPHAADAVSSVVACRDEVAAARRAGCDPLAALTVVFSAKESVFKCLSSRVGRVFEFHDVRFLDADPVTHTFVARVTNALSPKVPAGLLLVGRFEIDGRSVTAGRRPGLSCFTATGAGLIDAFLA
jgi:4'-phosphopantetheinyl transferase EntD